MPDWLTPPQLAAQRGIKAARVIHWIRSGELRAVNLATSQLGPARWRIPQEALRAFDAARSNRPLENAARPARRGRRPARGDDGITPYF